MLPHSYIPYYRMPLEKEVYPNGVFFPKRSQKLKNKRLKAKNKKRR